MSVAREIRRAERSNGLTRRRGKLIVVSAATLICLYLCWRLARPFLPALVWAVTAAVVTQPVVHWLGRWIRPPGWRALAAVVLVVIVVFGPVASLVYFAAVEIVESVRSLDDGDYLARLQTILDQHPRLASAWSRLAQALDLRTAVTQLVEQVRDGAMNVLSGSAYSLLQAMLAFFVLFYLYRDERAVLESVRQLSPLTGRETNRLLSRLDDTVHATVFGIVMVAIVQGVMGGLMFWLLGLPTPALWGTVMGLLAIVPYLGTFVVWGPAALFLALGGSWGQALALAAWGVIAIGLIDNLLYPMLVGNRLHQHTVIAFLAIVGGVAVFGAAGIILGPVIVTLTVFLLEVWRRRTSAGQAAENV